MAAPGDKARPLFDTAEKRPPLIKSRLIQDDSLSPSGVCSRSSRNHQSSSSSSQMKSAAGPGRAVRWASSLAPNHPWACRCSSLQVVASCRCDGYRCVFPLGDLRKGPPLRSGLSRGDFLNTSLKNKHETQLPGRYGFHPTKGSSGTARLVAAVSRQVPALLEASVMGTACGTPGRVIQEHMVAVLSTEVEVLEGAVDGACPAPCGCVTRASPLGLFLNQWRFGPCSPWCDC